jgi:hypothetical protein
MENLAVERGYESLCEPAMRDSAPSDADIAHALREPVSMVAVFNDLCQLLNVELPVVVKLAIGD